MSKSIPFSSSNGFASSRISACGTGVATTVNFLTSSSEASSFDEPLSSELLQAARVTVNNNTKANKNLFMEDRKSTRLNSSHVSISYAVFCLKKKINKKIKHQ